MIRAVLYGANDLATMSTAIALTVSLRAAYFVAAFLQNAVAVAAATSFAI